MARASVSDPVLRIYEPSFGQQYPTRQEQLVSRSHLLHKIHNSYRKAIERLNPRARPGMAERILSGGLCLGLLDPVENIVANTLMPSNGRRGDCQLVHVPEEQIKDLARRSLDGLCTFLTRFFPYLADCEAVSFLLLANADLLIALRMVVTDLGMKRFGSSDAAVEDAFGMALRCAVLAAKHPEPEQIVSGWLTISRCLDGAVSILDKVRRRSEPSSLEKLADMLNREAAQACGDLWGPWRLATSRRPPASSVPYQRTHALKGTLQDAIHGFYLNALIRLPAGELRSRFHRSLFKAGHCYGPFDPVSNIIINTIWYDTVYPPTTKLELDMISTLGLHRIENRSLYGLTSFVSTLHPHVDFHEAMDLLLQTDACLLIHDRKCYFMDCFLSSMDKKVQGPMGSIEKAFLAAATAGYHPKPEAQVELFTLCMLQMERLTSLLCGCDQLSSENVQLLAKLLAPEPPSSKQQLRSFPFPEYLCLYNKIFKQVNAALEAYAMLPYGEPFELHTICGVNSNVSGPVGIAPEFYRSHINFLATQRHGGGTPVLFFAEVSNNNTGEADTRPLCCIVSVPKPGAERVRCLYCDYNGIRIVHPVGKEFHGRKWDFEKMVCGEDPCEEDFDPAFEQLYYTNMKIIDWSSITTDRVKGWLKDDNLYDESFVNESDQSDLSSMSDEDDSMSDAYHVPAKAWAQITFYEP